MRGSLTDYVNSAEVRKALNIPADVQPFEVCSAKVVYGPQAEGGVWAYNSFVKNRYRVLVYSGDVDGKVPMSGTRSWITSLGWGVKQEWKQRTTADNQVAGYYETYENDLDFVTFHGAGH